MPADNRIKYKDAGTYKNKPLATTASKILKKPIPQPGSPLKRPTSKK